MHEANGQGATDPANNSGRLGRGDGKDRDGPTLRGSIARRTPFPAAVLVDDVEKREKRELAAGRRTVSVKGSGGVTAAVVVTVQQRGTVWLSIQPPLTWEAIMNPDKVDELMQTLVQAHKEARKTAEGYRL